MKYLEDTAYLAGYLFFNAFALAAVAAAIKWPRVARWLFFLLFIWASPTNWSTVLRNPEACHNYAGFAVV